MVSIAFIFLIKTEQTWPWWLESRNPDSAVMVRVAAVHSRARGRRIPEFETSLVYTGRFKTAKATEENPEPKQTNKNLNKQQNKQAKQAKPKGHALQVGGSECAQPLHVGEERVFQSCSLTWGWFHSDGSVS